jgi:hypothetical protein
LVSWPKFNTRDLLVAMILLGIGFNWPILLILIAPFIGSSILARMGCSSAATRVLFAVATANPVLWLALIYLTWAITWCELGHQPIPGNDDLRHISAFVSALGGVAAMIFFGLPFAFFVGIISLMLTVDAPVRKLKLAGVAFVAIWLAVGVWSAADPGQAIEWFFD